MGIPGSVGSCVNDNGSGIRKRDINGEKKVFPVVGEAKHATMKFPDDEMIKGTRFTI